MKKIPTIKLNKQTKPRQHVWILWRELTPLGWKYRVKWDNSSDTKGDIYRYWWQIRWTHE